MTILHKFLHASLIASSLFIFACQPREITSAKLYMRSGQWTQALEQLELAVARHPENVEVHYLLGRAYGQKGRYKEMNREFDAALALSDEFAEEVNTTRELHWIDKYNRGITALDKNKNEQAELWFKTAIRIAPQKYEAYKKLATAHLALEKPVEALTLYAGLLDKEPDNLKFLLTAGNLYYSLGQYAEVIPLLTRALQIAPDHRDALANIAFSYDAMGRTGPANEAYRRAIKANPNDQDLIFLFAVHHYKKEEFGQAIGLFQQVLDLSPEEFEATSNIGNAYLSLAEKLRIQLNSFTASAEEILELKNQVILNFKHAIPYLEKALRMQDNHPTLWRNLGVAYFNTGRVEEGEQAFVKAEGISLQTSKN